MSLYARLKNVLLSAAVFFIIAGCALEDLADYSSPQETYESYLRHAKTLRVVADHRSYRRAIRCFTSKDRRWFENNFTLLRALSEVEVEEDIYKHLYLTKRKAYIFGRAVVPAGPGLNAEFEIEKISDKEALLKVQGFKEEIQMINDSRGWRMKGMFGLPGKFQK